MKWTITRHVDVEQSAQVEADSLEEAQKKTPDTGWKDEGREVTAFFYNLEDDAEFVRWLENFNPPEAYGDGDDSVRLALEYANAGDIERARSEMERFMEVAL